VSAKDGRVSLKGRDEVGDREADLDRHFDLTPGLVEEASSQRYF
jgi:hypothetical protein